MDHVWKFALSMLLALQVLSLLFDPFVYSEEGSDSEPIFIYSNRTIREDVDDVFKVKIWHPEEDRFITYCMDTSGNIFDCNLYLQARGRLVLRQGDRDRLARADDSTEFEAVVYIRVPGHNPTVFSSRLNIADTGTDEQIQLVNNSVAELINRTDNALEVQDIIYELPAVVLHPVSKSNLLQIVNDNAAMKIRLVAQHGLVNLELPYPYIHYPFDSIETLNWGDVYWAIPFLRGMYSAKIAIVEQTFPLEHPEFHLPWMQDDKFYQSGNIFDDQNHATIVTAVVFWVIHETHVAGLLFNSRPFWVSLSPTSCDDPAKYLASLNWLVSKQINVANVSQLAPKVPDAPPAGIELAYDWKTWAHGRPLFVFAAGNNEAAEILQRSWNGIIVGATEQHSTYAPDGFSWRNPDSYYSDRELPDMVSFPCYKLPKRMYSQEEGYYWGYYPACGTSLSAPGVTSLAGLIVEKMKLDGYTSQDAETIRAVVYASGADSCDPYWKFFFPNLYRFGYWTDCERGTGDINPDIAVDVIDNHTWDFVYVNSSSYEYIGLPFAVASGTSFRAAIAWSQPVSCDSSGENCDNVDGQLVHDFDLYLQEATGPNGPWSTPSPFGGGDKLSIRNDSSWELIDTSNLNPLRFYRLRAVLSINGTFQPTFMGIAWRTY